MPGFQIYKNLASLNELNTADAEALFLKCCGSDEWARRMEKARPFALVEDLFASAEMTWGSVPPDSRLEAFQAEGMNGTSLLSSESEPNDELAAVYHLYEERFGFIFIVNSIGRSRNEITAICRARLGNSAKTELIIAECEYDSIIRGRLKKLLER
ncbi:MAG: 2-oxo-4-hydroxy-4-carboxy-5-ureidoimidazoline decarboxylase [Pyrinomonadaceae bacterium]